MIFQVTQSGRMELLKNDFTLSQESVNKIIETVTEGSKDSPTIVLRPSAAPCISSATSANPKEVAGLFKFLADNTSVEWVIHTVGSDYTLGTIHENGSAGSWMDYGIVKKPERSLHSQVGIYRPLFIRTWK